MLVVLWGDVENKIIIKRIRLEMVGWFCKMERLLKKLYFRFVEEKRREGRNWKVGIWEVWEKF